MKDTIYREIEYKRGDVLTGRDCPDSSVHVVLPSGKDVLLVPALGVPTANTLQAAEDVSQGSAVAVVYDHVGLLPAWQSHLAWLGERINTVHWMKASDIAWQLAGMEDA